MAIDTANKRRLLSQVAPIPDGTIDANDRRAISFIYFGLTLIDAFYKTLEGLSAITMELSGNSSITTETTGESAITTSISGESLI